MDLARDKIIYVDRLAGVIRGVDGNHSMGAGELAEAIVNSGYLEEFWAAAQAELLTDQKTLAVAIDVLRGYGHDAIGDALVALPTQLGEAEVEWEYGALTPNEDDMEVIGSGTASQVPTLYPPEQIYRRRPAGSWTEVQS